MSPPDDLPSVVRRELESLRAVPRTWASPPSPVTAAALHEWLGEHAPTSTSDCPATSAPDIAHQEPSELFELGQSWLGSGNFGRARKYFHDALDIAGEETHPEYRVAILTQLVVAETECGADDTALERAIDAASLLERKPNAEMEALLYHNLALVLAQRRDFARSARLALHAVEESAKQVDVDAFSAALGRLSNAYRLMGESQSALGAAEAAVAVAVFGGPYIRCGALLELANCCARTGDFNRSLEAVRELRSLLGMSSHNLRCKSLIVEARVHSLRGSFNAALAAISRAADLAHSLQFPEDEELAESELGILLLALGDPEQALVHLRRSIRIAKRRRKWRPDRCPYAHIAACYLALGHLNEAAAALDVLARLAAVFQNLVTFGTVELLKAQLSQACGRYGPAREFLVSGMTALGGWNEDCARLWPEAFAMAASMALQDGDHAEAGRILAVFDRAWPEGPPGFAIPSYALVKSALSVDARHILIEGVARLRDLRSSLPRGLPRQALALEAAGDLFRRLIELELDTEDSQAVYDRCQQARAQHLASLLAATELAAPATVDPQLAEREERLLGVLRSRLGELAVPALSYDEAMNQADYDSTAEELSQVWDDMTAMAPAYVRARRAQPMTFPEICELLV